MYSEFSGEEIPGLMNLLRHGKLFKLKIIIKESGYDLQNLEKVARLRLIYFASEFLAKLALRRLVQGF